MTDHVEHQLLPTVAPEVVIALVDQALVNAGFPAYSSLAENLRRWHDTLGARIEAMALGTAIAETRRLRAAHGVIASEVGAALAAFTVGDTTTGMDLLDEAKAFSEHHALLETTRPLAENVIDLAAHRIVRMSADMGRA